MVGAEYGVHGADGQHVSALGRGFARQHLESAGVPQSSVARAAQGIDLGGQTPDAGVALSRQAVHVRAGAGRRGQGKTLFPDQQTVVAALADPGQFGLIIKPAVDDLPTFKFQPVGGACGKVPAEGKRLILVVHQQRGQGVRTLQLLYPCQAVGDLLIALGGEAKLFQNGALGIKGHGLRLAKGVRPVRVDADRRGQLTQLLVAHCGLPPAESERDTSTALAASMLPSKPCSNRTSPAAR